MNSRDIRENRHRAMRHMRRARDLLNEVDFGESKYEKKRSSTDTLFGGFLDFGSGEEDSLIKRFFKGEEDYMERSERQNKMITWKEPKREFTDQEEEMKQILHHILIGGNTKGYDTNTKNSDPQIQSLRELRELLRKYVTRHKHDAILINENQSLIQDCTNITDSLNLLMWAIKCNNYGAVFVLLHTSDLKDTLDPYIMFKENQDEAISAFQIALANRHMLTDETISDGIVTKRKASAGQIWREIVEKVPDKKQQMEQLSDKWKEVMTRWGSELLGKEK